jgi:hypothetical protein
VARILTTIMSLIYIPYYLTLLSPNTYHLKVHIAQSYPIPISLLPHFNHKFDWSWQHVLTRISMET